MENIYIYIDIIANRSITGAVIITRDDESEGARRYLWQLVAIDKEILSGQSYKPANDQQKQTQLRKIPKQYSNCGIHSICAYSKCNCKSQPQTLRHLASRKYTEALRKGKHPVAAYYGNYLRREKSPREIEHEAFPRFSQPPSTIRHQINHLHRATQTPEAPA